MSLATFLCPTRGRPESFVKSVESLRSTAYDPGCFEVLAYVDRDDPSADVYTSLDMPGVRVHVGPSLGYARLHECIASIVGASQGVWVWLWNDDAVMDTEHWDLKIRKVPVNQVLCPDTNHQSHATGLNVFPAVPKAWVDLVGWSRDGANDTWWQYIGQLLNAQINVPVHITHDRSDLTGGHQDATRAGNNYDSATFYADATQAGIRADALRIAEVFG